ncbi:uncharacterized protein CC84DRAFT_1170625 [Paraphaeosphaeria sporulosa]|uniref:Uncharacterized protein n=1 Tax=Paraphaeosphaeria sporulosa TaxID=1460663 RepID=A0A177CYH9_9PLEO|nr:uncharacterized protein CC84DRAFT_1170625 [Paraphaeosphaeria sporulosa]OAG11779.1 hypothetical protein CC84DRAFT_1170625 [Paraphaeosphaeria sporulosa]
MAPPTLMDSISVDDRANVKSSSIPADLRLESLLKNQATIDAQSRLTIRDVKKQHIDITRAIYFWRFDDLHQFQRYRDSARWNIAIFIALLTDVTLPSFIGVLIPGPRSQRALYYRAPNQKIEDLKLQSDISGSDMQPGLLETLKANEPDYYVPTLQRNTKPKVNTEPPQIPNTTILDFAVQDAEFLEVQKPKPEASTTDWPALHFPKTLPPNLGEQKAAEVVDVKEAIWFLKNSKPQEMLAKLMELFPEELPVRQPIFASSTPTSLPTRPEVVTPPTFEDLGAFVGNNVPKDSMDSAAHSKSVASMSSSSSSQVNQQTSIGKRSAGEQDEGLEERE